MRTLRGRVVGSFALLALAVLVAVGGILFVLLRDLHAEANSAALADAALPLVSQARQRIDAGGPPRVVLRELEQQTAASDISLFLVDRSGRVVELGSDLPVDQVDLGPPGARGSIDRGTFAAPGAGTYVYVAAPFGAALGKNGPWALVLARPDDSGRRALADLVRALVVAGLVVLVVGALLAAWLSRSVTRPLGRLAAAAGDVGRGRLPEPLPEDGPREVARASAAFNAMSAEVGHARRTQAELLAGLRHDLRTPLTVIGGFAEALLDGTADGPDAARAARAIADETDRLERMVDDLGDLADLESGGRPLHLEQLDGATLTAAAVERFGPRASAEGQELVALPAPGPLPLAADRSAVERILGNLVANGLAHAPRPGGRVAVEAATLTGGELLIAVRDDGPGIPPAALSRVFERFYRAEPSRSGSGTGLGLAIVDQLAHAHGGRAFAENLPGRGARVGVVLPITPPPAHDSR
jgi:two-component system sensor histidine kinase BaeS